MGLYFPMILQQEAVSVYGGNARRVMNGKRKFPVALLEEAALRARELPKVVLPASAPNFFQNGMENVI